MREFRLVAFASLLVACGVEEDASLGAVNQLVLAPDGRLWAAAEGGVFTSADGGLTWSPAAALTRVRGVQHDGDSVWAASLDDGVVRLAMDGAMSVEGPALTLAGGKSCDAIALGPLASRPYGNEVYASVLCEDVALLVKTVDGGASWTALDGTGAILGSLSVADDGTVWAAPHRLDPAILWVSRDGGASWSAITDGCHGTVVDTVIAPRGEPGLVYGAGRNGDGARGGVWRTRDGGISWQLADAGLPPGARVGSFAVSPTDARTLAATVGGAVYRSSDGGDTWTMMEERLPSWSYAMSITFSVDGLVVGTDRGVFVWTAEDWQRGEL